MPPKKSNLNARSKKARRARVERAQESVEQRAERNAAQRIRTAEIRARESQEQRDIRRQENALRTRSRPGPSSEFLPLSHIGKYVSSWNDKEENPTTDKVQVFVTNVDVKSDPDPLEITHNVQTDTRHSAKKRQYSQLPAYTTETMTSDVIYKEIVVKEEPDEMELEISETPDTEVKLEPPEYDADSTATPQFVTYTHRTARH